VVNASWPDHTENVPLVVLVDGSTGYGTEEVVAALQDNGRALVIGSTTQGDGIVRANVRLFNMGDIWMRVAFSYAPSGYGLAGRGVMPHVCTSAVSIAPDDLMATLRAGRGVVAAEVRRRHIDPQDEEALKAFRALCPPTVDEDDLTLDLALAILEEPDLYGRLMQQAGAL
jgi:carboxyl-terminal processing protease